MPIKFDKEPGSVKKYQRTKDIPVVVPEPAPAPAPETKRIRILRNIIGSRHGSFLAGEVVRLDAVLARSWVAMGLAEEDKSLDGPKETK